MRRYWWYRAAGVILALLPALGAEALVRVVTTTPDLAALAREVGGEQVEVTAIVNGLQDPHYVEAKPTHIRRLNRADLLIYNGMELEIGWLPLLIEGSRNPRLLPGSLGLMDASEAVEVKLEVPQGEVDRSQGDVHPLGNPHYLLDPRNGVQVARAIAERLGQIDPDHQKSYLARAERFAEEMAERIARWERETEVLRGLEVIAYHRTWSYLSAWLGFHVVGYFEEKPGIPPGPRHLAILESLVRSRGVQVALAAHYNPLRGLEAFARRAGIRLVVLPASVEAREDVRSYPELFDRIVLTLREAFGEGS
ncbi:MAG: adhesin [Candidatus Poribacteria bacterium]|nr:MAG: adhesin [Candidatus Poribacteria bacterium]